MLIKFAQDMNARWQYIMGTARYIAHHKERRIQGGEIKARDDLSYSDKYLEQYLSWKSNGVNINLQIVIEM